MPGGLSSPQRHPHYVLGKPKRQLACKCRYPSVTGIRRLLFLLNSTANLLLDFSSDHAFQGKDSNIGEVFQTGFLPTLSQPTALLRSSPQQMVSITALSPLPSANTMTNALGSRSKFVQEQATCPMVSLSSHCRTHPHSLIRPVSHWPMKTVFFSCPSFLPSAVYSSSWQLPLSTVGGSRWA